MTVTSLINRGRARASGRGRMPDTCRIVAPGSTAPVYNPDTDTYTYPTGSTLYEGRCEVTPAELVDRRADAGVAIVSTRGYIVKLPAPVVGVRVGHVVEMLTSALDPALPGTKMRVDGALKGSFLTSRRLACTETTS